MSKEKIKKVELEEIEQRLNEIKDTDILLENILTYARQIVNADAASIYEFDKLTEILTIKVSQNETLRNRLGSGQDLPYVSFSYKATTKMISGYCALKCKGLNISDVYNMDEYLDVDKKIKRPYNFSPETDIKTNYHTTSMLTYPFLLTTGAVAGVLQVINAKDDYGNIIPFDEEAEYCISQLATRVGQIYEKAYTTRKSMNRLVKMAGYRDPKETASHVDRVAAFSVEIYDRYASRKEIGEAERNHFRDNLRIAARCHDVGKVGVPDGILKKPGKLTEDERNIMKGHTCIGAQIFTPIESDLDEMTRDVCLHHHDWWNGDTSGYPGDVDYMDYEPSTSLIINSRDILKGEQIPLAARIVAIADVYDALRHARSYKEGWTEEDTFNEIKRNAGLQFDPELVDVFLDIKNRIEEINKAIS